MKLRKAYKAISSSFYWHLYYKEDGKQVVIPASGRHWYLFQKACIRLHRSEVIEQYSKDVQEALD